MNLSTLIEQFKTNGHFKTIASNPLAQFGPRKRRYVGAELLPEKLVKQNAYREMQVRWRTVIANAGTRYSPAQKKGGDLIGTVLVELGHGDIAREMDAEQYDMLTELLETSDDMRATALLTNWLDTTVNLALVEMLEAERWQAMINASVVRTGDNGFTETISYPDPANHRVTPAAAWSTDTTDIFGDIQTQAQVIKNKGYDVGRIITSSAVVAIMAGNDTVKTRVGVSVVNASGQIVSAAGHATLEAINRTLQADGLPFIEVYDKRYATEEGTMPFIPAGSMLLVATTGRDIEVDTGDNEPMFLEDTIGYTAIGKAAGMGKPGRVIRAEAKESKPPRIEAEGWYTGLPVLTEPEALAVIKGIG